MKSDGPVMVEADEEGNPPSLLIFKTKGEAEDVSRWAAYRPCVAMPFEDKHNTTGWVSFVVKENGSVKFLTEQYLF